MEIDFQRVLNDKHRTQILRDDGVRVAVPAYDRTSPIPHDLAHYVVEDTLKLDRGFWASVAAGCLLPGMAVVAGRQKPHASERSRQITKANRRTMIESEVLVAAFMQVYEAAPGEPAARTRGRLMQRLADSRLYVYGLDAETIDRVSEGLKLMHKRWRALNNKQTLILDWPARPSSTKRVSEQPARRLIHRRRQRPRWAARP